MNHFIRIIVISVAVCTLFSATGCKIQIGHADENTLRQTQLETSADSSTESENEPTSESQELAPPELVPEAKPEDSLSLRLLLGCVWDASVQTSQLFQFFPDGNGIVINLASQLQGKGEEREFTYLIEGNTVRIFDTPDGSSIHWEYDSEADIFRTKVDETGYGDYFDMTICRVSFFTLYDRWAESIQNELRRDANREDINEIAYICWKTALDSLYLNLSSVLSPQDATEISAEQDAWTQELSALLTGSTSDYLSAAELYEIRFFDLLLRLPDGFDFATHEIQVQDVCDKYAWIQESEIPKEIRYFGTSATGFYMDGNLCALHEASDVSQGENPYDYADDPYLNCLKRWYYDGTYVFFIHMVNEENGDEYRLYFYEGKLIRWIDPLGRVFNYGYRWDEMQSFYDHALSQCQYAAENPPE